MDNSDSSRRTVYSLSEFIRSINRLQKSRPATDRDKKLGHPNFFYRGQCNQCKPIPGIYRKDNHFLKEDVLYHELILRCPEHFRGLSHIDTLVLMQHYGLPTRLLDITSNPLVALYFACKDYRGNNKDGNGFVYVYLVADDYLTYSDSDRVLMLTCLPVFSSSDKEKMLDMIEENKGKEALPILKSKPIYPAAIERLFHEITKEVPAFKREIRPQDLVTPVIVKPLLSNDRIIKQDGAFIVSGLCRDKVEAVTSIDKMCGYTIEVENKEEILQELDAVGINEASLFPEVDKVAGYLYEKYK